MDSISGETLANLAVPLPPIPEQQSIVEYLAMATSQIDAVRVMTEQTVGLLIERRSALIAEAITGRLAVQGVSADAG
jgi:type I restriction enzyme S subunit